MPEETAAPADLSMSELRQMFHPEDNPPAEAAAPVVVETPAGTTPPKVEPVSGKPRPVLVIPNIEDFEYDTERHEAAKTEAIAKHSDELTDWKLDQREAQRQATARQESQQSAEQTKATRIE